MVSTLTEALRAKYKKERQKRRLLKGVMNMVELALIAIFGLAMGYVCRQNKKNWKDSKEHNKLLKQQEKRRVKEEKLRTMRIKHPKVIYLDDRRFPQPTQRII